MTGQFSAVMGDHLWQSTLFALAVGLLAWVLRNNRATDRYWLWFAASLKFLLPFSVLAHLGSRLAWMPNPAGTKSGLFLAVNEFSRPFSQPLVRAPLIHLPVALLAAVWLGGAVVVLAAWYLRWRNLSAQIRTAVPLREGREVEVLRRMQRIAGIKKPIAMLLSPACLEPGIFGIVRPILVWPEGISAHFEDAHLQAVIAHEVWHVRRRDNLAAALHMVVEALFWFHPLVWWLGTRLVAERERACDEKVLELGSERRIYAESILKTCRFCARLPLPCLSGVTGADLNKRIVEVMTQRAARKLNLGRRLLLGTAGLITIAVPTLLGSLNAASAQAAQTDTPADTTMLQLLQAGSVTGATCPNAVPPADPFFTAGGNPARNH
jgi:beta-lactamase regulating signal transducer with metallopeptidase domain